jgi:hypothetical protein
MKSFKQYLEEKGRCWTGYKPVLGKKPFSNDSCVKEDGAAAAVPGPTNVTGVATSTDPVSATAVNRKKKITPILLSIRRKPPKG